MDNQGFTAIHPCCLVVGASRGVGAATASRFVQAGYVTYGTHSGAGVPHGVRSLEANVTDDASVRFAAQSIITDCGGIDTAVINASVAHEDLLARTTPAVLEEVFRVSTLGAIRAAKHIASVMNRQGSGSIVLLSPENSRAGIQGSSYHAASRSALEELARDLMWKCGHRGIRVNVVMPGLTEIDMFSQFNAEHRTRLLERTPLRRFGQPQEIAEAIHWVSESTYLTGACIPITGGEGFDY